MRGLRLSGPAVAVIGAAAVLLAGCTSSGGGASTPTAPVPTVPSVTVTLPSAPPSVSVPVRTGTAGGGTADAFCHDFTSADLGNLYDTSKVDQVVKLWDTLTGDAPSGIADDMQAIDAYLHKVADGNPVPPGSDFARAIKHVTGWVAAHCR